MEVLGTVAPTGGFIATLVAMAWLVYTGKLVPRSVLDDVRADRDVRLAEEQAEKEHWRKAAETSAAQLSTVLPNMGTIAQVLQSLPAPPTEEAP